MRRDLDLETDPAALVLSPPDRSELAEIFRRFEFRNLLNRIDELDVALPAAARSVRTSPMPWREELTLPADAGPVGVATVDGRTARGNGRGGRRRDRAGACIRRVGGARCEGPAAHRDR